ncbi:zinc finger protein 593 [Octopus bimaculoides]|uniref:C2H2-type domain-containing protein n=1 Tax=Octopus bimaculoides TaxID=37653 RepID=A0A0L8HLV9_OCTBM|nr:zinc finger protein 593 [Octopus bimaculoides]|eukprot:XP_014771291.1 PREDICTED: zinc finger protein 593-like [Octopus bimaculoides]
MTHTSKKGFHKNKSACTFKKKWKTKRYGRDVDQIHDDMKPAVASKLLNQAVNYDLPGAAQFYCLHCSKYFISNFAMKEHFRGKPHKRRIKELKTEPYSQAEAERAAGMGSYIAPKTVHVETQQLKPDSEIMEF